ncbi:uncharacterized protein A4U43_C08F15790 [Asparagus officinalis]|nr:uncharacterized protein A4U43_C08F15790 [Asparagus officinalis]
MGPTPWEIDLLPVDHHPPLIRLLIGKVRMGNVGLPHLVPAGRPPDGNLRTRPNNTSKSKRTRKVPAPAPTPAAQIASSKQDDDRFGANKHTLYPAGGGDEAVVRRFGAAMAFVVLHQGEIQLELDSAGR